MSRHTIDRREFLASGITLAGAGVLGASALACFDNDPTAPAVAAADASEGAQLAKTGGDLAEPSVISSVGGVLSATIVAETRPVNVAGRMVLQPVTYNGSFPGPTLWVRPGDLVNIRFTNRIVFDQADEKPGYGRPPRDTHAADLHYHGMHMSPTGTADNMLVMVQPNGSFNYSFQVPTNHPAGLFWYHDHIHGLVTNHVSRGAAGMLYVANNYTDQIGSMGIRRRLMMLQQVYLDDDERRVIFDDGERDNPQRALSVINGQLLPDIQMQRGETQVWSLCNASTSAFYKLRLEGHTFDVIAQDGIPFRAPGLLDQATLLLASGTRLEVVVRANAVSGRYTLSYDAYNQGVDTWPQKSVATVVVGSEQWSGPAHPGVDVTHQVEDLSLVTVADEHKRTIVLGVNPNVAEGEFGRFTMNGHAWDPTYREWTSTLGTVEEWHITNETEQQHPFHVHVNPFQVTKINGIPVPSAKHQDVAIVPIFGSITVRTRFTDFAGGPVLMHCHILDHEDMGMMTAFDIVP
jgi:FtsP/CotA-like multicopper oxidase with cupredoxin domain